MARCSASGLVSVREFQPQFEMTPLCSDFEEFFANAIGVHRHP